jgi:YHS domain-containing protein
MILGWIVRFVLLLLILRLVFRFVAGLIQGLSGAPSRSPIGGGQPGVRARRGSAVALARDPVCGTYVVPGKVTLVSKGTTYQFCSEACRRAFEERTSGSRIA